MTISPLTKTELAHAFTPDSPDDAPSVDGNGDPRFITARDMADADAWQQELDDDHAAEAYAEWQAEQWLDEQARWELDAWANDDRRF